MNKKHGFTLIELLAVIVVLAILALILVPIVTTTIKNAKKGSAEISAQHYVKAVELAISNSELNKKHIPDGTYTIDSEGNLTGTNLPNGKLEIEATGTKPNGGTIVIKNGQVTTESTMTVGDYDVKYDSTSKEYIATEKGSTTEVLCTAKTAATTGNVPSGNYAYGDEYTCELGDNEAKTFFVLETNGDNVSLIMDKNIDSTGKGTTSGNTVAWCKSGSSNSCAADGALEYLKNSTTSWTKLTESQITLPTGQQIATAGGDSAWTDSNATYTTLSAWLYGNLNDSSTPQAYWTSTPNKSDSNTAWYVSCYGYLFNIFGVGYGDGGGIRPVITVAKSQLG